MAPEKSLSDFQEMEQQLVAIPPLKYGDLTGNWMWAQTRAWGFRQWYVLLSESQRKSFVQAFRNHQVPLTVEDPDDLNAFIWLFVLPTWLNYKTNMGRVYWELTEKLKLKLPNELKAWINPGSGHRGNTPHKWKWAKLDWDRVLELGLNGPEGTDCPLWISFEKALDAEEDLRDHFVDQGFTAVTKLPGWNVLRK
jgi:hypothetical protein